MKELALYDTAPVPWTSRPRRRGQGHSRQGGGDAGLRTAGEGHHADPKATNVRLRAERRAGELLAKMEKNKGGGERGVGRRGKNAVAANDRIPRSPTSASLRPSHRTGSRSPLSTPMGSRRWIDETPCQAGARHRNAMREVEIEQERANYRARTYEGCTVEDLESLIGKIKFGAIVPDFAWPFEVYSDKGKQRSAERHYDTMSLAEIIAMAPLIAQLAAPDCALLLWAVCPEHPAALEFIKACGFDYKTVGFHWVKTTPNAEAITLDGDGLHWGMGYHTRANIEPVLLATHGSPQRLASDVHSVVIAPVGEHSAKPDEVYHRIERLFPGPRLELFARRERAGWWTWGDEISRVQFKQAAE